MTCHLAQRSALCVQAARRPLIGGHYVSSHAINDSSQSPFRQRKATFSYSAPRRGVMARSCEPKPHSGEVLETRDRVCKRDSREPSGRRESLHTRTVQTLVYRLEEKGALRKVRKIGNAQLFQPVINQSQYRSRRVRDLLDLFGGSARAHFQSAREWRHHLTRPEEAATCGGSQ